MQTIKDYIKGLFEHPKTTFSGVLVLGLVGIYLLNYISEAQLTVAIATLVGYGMISSADAKKKDAE